MGPILEWIPNIKMPSIRGVTSLEIRFSKENSIEKVPFKRTTIITCEKVVYLVYTANILLAMFIILFKLYLGFQLLR